MCSELSDKLSSLTRKVIEFRDERDWAQYHNPKDAIISLSLEASELLELTQWKNGDELIAYLSENREALADELCDVLYWVLVIAHDLNVDIPAEFDRKMLKNARKYPVEKAMGKAEKYNRL